MEDLVAGGSLSEGLGVSLSAKLKAVDIEKPKQASNVLNAFINHVEALMNTGKLTLEEGQALIDAANSIIEQLNQ